MFHVCHRAYRCGAGGASAEVLSVDELSLEVATHDALSLEDDEAEESLLELELATQEADEVETWAFMSPSVGGEATWLARLKTG